MAGASTYVATSGDSDGTNVWVAHMHFVKAAFARYRLENQLKTDVLVMYCRSSRTEVLHLSVDAPQ